MAPNATGNHEINHERIMASIYSVTIAYYKGPFTRAIFTAILGAIFLAISDDGEKNSHV